MKIACYTLALGFLAASCLCAYQGDQYRAVVAERDKERATSLFYAKAYLTDVTALQQALQAGQRVLASCQHALFLTAGSGGLGLDNSISFVQRQDGGLQNRK